MLYFTPTTSTQILFSNNKSLPESYMTKLSNNCALYVAYVADHMQYIHWCSLSLPNIPCVQDVVFLTYNPIESTQDKFYVFGVFIPALNTGWKCYSLQTSICTYEHVHTWIYHLPERRPCQFVYSHMRKSFALSKLQLLELIQALRYNGMDSIPVLHKVANTIYQSWKEGNDIIPSLTVLFGGMQGLYTTNNNIILFVDDCLKFWPDSIRQRWVILGQYPLAVLDLENIDLYVTSLLRRIILQPIVKSATLQHIYRQALHLMETPDVGHTILRHHHFPQLEGVSYIYILQQLKIFKNKHFKMPFLHHNAPRCVQTAIATPFTTNDIRYELSCIIRELLPYIDLDQSLHIPEIMSVLWPYMGDRRMQTREELSANLKLTLYKIRPCITYRADAGGVRCPFNGDVTLCMETRETTVHKLPSTITPARIWAGTIPTH